MSLPSPYLIPLFSCCFYDCHRVLIAVFAIYFSHVSCRNRLKTRGRSKLKSLALKASDEGGEGSVVIEMDRKDVNADEKSSGVDGGNVLVEA